jgi:hypothetical protein
MAVVRDYTLWDTVVLGTVALTETLLFQVAQGGDATHTESYTNSPGAGSLPGQQEFLIQEVHLILDTPVLPADILKLHQASFLEIRISEHTELKIPSQMAVSYSAYGGHFVTATAEQAGLGLLGNGFILARPIRIPGATPWKVRYVQGTALAVGSKNLRCVLRGELTSET